MGRRNLGGFSWKRATGITAAKRKITKKTGIPLSKSGRQRKIGKAVTGGGCIIPVIIFVAAVITAIVIII